MSACAETITSAYRSGDYAHMWEALTEALHSRDDYHDELTSDILAKIICTLQWDKQPITPDAFDDAAFTRVVIESLSPSTTYETMTLSLVIENLGEGDDMERANSLAIMERAARIILANMPTSGDSDTQRIRHSPPIPTSSKHRRLHHANARRSGNQPHPTGKRHTTRRSHRRRNR